MAKLSEDTKKKLRDIAKKHAEKIAEEFEEKMCEKYQSLIDRYYNEPYQTGKPHYNRTENLRKSSSTFTFISDKKVTGSFIVTGQNMNDYAPNFTGERLLKRYFFIVGTPSVTWHGGDYHGGRGTMAKFSIAEETYKYYDSLVKELRGRYGL